MIALIGFIIIILGSVIIEANAQRPAGQDKHNKEVQKYREALRRVWNSND